MSAETVFWNPRPEPVPSYKFQVFINNIRMGFSRVTNIEESIETEPLQEGGVNDRVYSLRAPVRGEKTLVLERGAGTRGLVLELLTLRFRVGQRIPGTMLILVSGRDGAITNNYEVHGAVNKKCKVGNLDAMSSEVLIESFELTYETLESHPLASSIVGSIMSAAGLSAIF